MINVSKGHDCFVITVNINDNVYNITASDDVPVRHVVELLMDQIAKKELGITSHDIWMKIADFKVSQ